MILLNNETFYIGTGIDNLIELLSWASSFTKGKQSPVLAWIVSEVDTETKGLMLVLNLRDYLRKHQRGVGKWDRQEKAVNGGCANEQVPQ